MRLFQTYVYPKIQNSIVNGVNSATVVFDELMKPSLFNELNMKQLCSFINKEIKVGYGRTTCKLATTQMVGNRWMLTVCWT